MSILQTVPFQSSCSGSSLGHSAGPEKRKHSVAFPESNPGTSTSQDPPPQASSSKRPFLVDQSQRVPSLYPSEGLSQTTSHPGPSPSRGLDSSSQRMVGLGSSSSHHSGTMFPHSHYPTGGPSQQAMLPQYGGGRKILMCSLDNCCCSRVPPARGRPSYPGSDSFPWVSSQEFPPHPPHPPLSSGQSLQGLSMRDWMDTSQTPRHPDFYGLYGQNSAKHYVTS